MDRQDIRTLRLLEAFEEEEQISQRSLIKRLNVALGQVNLFLKCLACKGYFKITNLPANRLSSLLTPQGMAEKSRLTCQYPNYFFYLTALMSPEEFLAEPRLTVVVRGKMIFMTTLD